MKKTFIITILISIILGLIFPFGDKIKFLLPILLSILLFFNFYEVNFNLKDFLRLEMLYFLIFGLGVLPFIIFVSTFFLPQDFRLGLFLIAITPTAIGASVVVRLLGGNIPFTIANTVFYNFLSIISYPLLLNIYFNKVESSVPVKQIFFNLLTMILLPFIISTIFKRIKIIKPFFSKVSKYINFLFIFIVFIAISSSAIYLRKTQFNILIIVILLTIVVAVLYFLTGFLLGKNIEYKKTLMSCLGQKNTGICIWIALSNFQPIVAISATLYIVIHHTINVILIYIFSRTNKKKKD
ncbi:MAG: hypothetical protein A2Z98_01370 [Spirochaetes bacterium GWB1_27_13]|nr:MAG: hypothetical protein A2Z98_01370 [Spirochaetes bacterium GWB1_27_13]